MNTLVLLMMTTCMPAQEPLPAIDSRYSTVPSYGSYGPSGLSDSGTERRPRFFGRLRNLFSRRFQGDDLYSRGNATYPNETSANNGYNAGSMMGNNYNPNGTTINNGYAGSTPINNGYTNSTPINNGYTGSTPTNPGYNLGTPATPRWTASPGTAVDGSTNPSYLRPQPAYPTPGTPMAKPATTTPAPF